MWIFVVYDCPMTNSERRHGYQVFHNYLLKRNFLQWQNSLYAKHFATRESAYAERKRIEQVIPEDAKVAFIYLTDKQFGMIDVFYGEAKTPKPQDAPEQFLLL
ncbi:CRISPR-associated endonuclease Cas2 [Photobacterium sp. BZF1]|nr:CRISPR-associated endonuclease Cas2 [Photobacterium sp. BZF1]